MTNKLKVMFALQNFLNSRINPTWKENNQDFETAILIETAEMIDSLNWEWWKQKKEDIDNAKVELVDIWHFYMSDILIKHGEFSNEDYETLERLVTHQFENRDAAAWAPENAKRTTCNVMKMFVAHVVSTTEGVSDTALLNFFDVVAHYFTDFNEFFVAFAMKNVLNDFRQKNGYKLGTYKKQWNGLEDNAAVRELFPSFADMFEGDNVQSSFAGIIDTLQTHYNTLD